MYIKNNNARYPCTGRDYSSASVSFTGCEGLPEAVSGTVELCNNSGFVLASYDTADYLRTVVEGGTLTLTDEPEPVPHVPTVEELRAAAQDRLKGKCSAAIYAGFDLGGKHYTATDNDQSNIKDALLAFSLGKTTYPWAAVGEARTPHTEAQITAIATGMSNWGIVCTGYLAQLRAWADAETDGAVLNSIDFGATLPEAYMQALGAELAQYGINLADYATILNK